MTPEERNAEWAKLNTVYYPYADYADLPFYSRGASWQWKMHIYLNPFYYVDYCIAQTIAFQFWTKSLENWDEAWKTYVEFAKKGGKYSFVELVKSAGLLSPLRRKPENDLLQSERMAAAASNGILKKQRNIF